MVDVSSGYNPNAFVIPLLTINCPNCMNCDEKKKKKQVFIHMKLRLFWQDFFRRANIPHHLSGRGWGDIGISGHTFADDPRAGQGRAAFCFARRGNGYKEQKRHSHFFQSKYWHIWAFALVFFKWANCQRGNYAYLSCQSRSRSCRRSMIKRGAMYSTA